MKQLFVALTPEREVSIKTAIEGINTLPTLEEGVAQLRTQTEEERHVDLPLDFSELFMDDDGGIKIAGDDLVFQYTRHALNQAVIRIKPEGIIGLAGYLAACPPDLRSTNFNFWHQFYYGPDADRITQNKVIMRTRFGEEGFPIIRAIMSQSYVPVDDAPLLKQFATVVPPGAHIRNARGDTRSRFDVFWPTMKQHLVRGEPLMVSMHLTNSETGVSSIRLEPAIYNTQRNSSIIIPATADVAIRHIGEAHRRLANSFDKAMNLVNPFIEMLNESYNDYMDDRFDTTGQLADCLKKAFKLSEAAMLAMENELGLCDNTSVAWDGSRAGLVDALAKVANRMPIEEGEELQQAAGVLVMKGWKPLERVKNG